MLLILPYIAEVTLKMTLVCQASCSDVITMPCICIIFQITVWLQLILMDSMFKINIDGL